MESRTTTRPAPQALERERIRVNARSHHPPSRQRVTRRDTGAIVAILAIAAVARVWSIGERALRHDEGFTLWVASLPWRQMPDVLATADTHPPLHYAIVKSVVLLFDASTTSIRLPGVLAGVVTVVVVGLLGGAVSGRRAGLFAAALLALSPFHAVMSEEARMYPWATLAVALVLWAVASVVPSTSYGDPACRLPVPAAWVVYAVGATLALYSHNLAPIVLLPATAALALAAARRELADPASWWMGWIGANLVALLAWAPWAPNFLAQVSSVEELGWLDPPSVRDVIGITRGTYAEFTRSGAADAGWLAEGTWTYGWLDLIVLILVATAVWRLSAPARVLLVGGAVVLPLLELSYTWLAQPIFHYKTFVMVVPAVVVLIATGAAGGIRYGWRRSAVLAVSVLLTVNGIALIDHERSFDPDRGYRETARALDARVAGDEVVVVFSSISTRTAVQHERATETGTVVTVELVRPAWSDGLDELARSTGTAAEVFTVRALEPIEAVLERTHERAECSSDGLCRWRAIADPHP